LFLERTINSTIIISALLKKCGPDEKESGTKVLSERFILINPNYTDTPGIHHNGRKQYK
jgi:hypothetical protein